MANKALEKSPARSTSNQQIPDELDVETDKLLEQVTAMGESIKADLARVREKLDLLPGLEVKE